MILSLLQTMHSIIMLLATGQGHHMMEMEAPPENIFFYLILITASIMVIAVTVWAVKLIFWPGENSGDHIKYKILED